MLTESSGPIPSLAMLSQMRRATWLAASAHGTLDFHIQHFRKAAVVDQSCQRVASRLLTQMILQVALFGYVLSDDLIGFQLVLLTHDFVSVEPDLQDRAVLALPFYFEGFD